MATHPVTEAAVLVPVMRRPNGLRLLMIRRTDHGPFGGQLAFPGGMRTPADASLVHTALREAAEEVGLFADEIIVLVLAEPVDTLTTNIRITPVLVEVPDPPERFAPDDKEVAEVVELDLQDLLDPAARVEEDLHFPTWPEPRRLPARRVGAELVWGVSNRILDRLEPHLRELSTS